MRVLFKLLRRSGIPLTPAQLAKVKWSAAVLESPSNRSGHLALRHGMSAPGQHQAELYQAAVVKVVGDEMVLRGIERTRLGDGEAAVVQEWRLRTGGFDDPSLGEVVGQTLEMYRRPAEVADA
jgi:hypothetical protein